MDINLRERDINKLSRRRVHYAMLFGWLQILAVQNSEHTQYTVDTSTHFYNGNDCVSESSRAQGYTCTLIMRSRLVSRSMN